MKGKKRILKSEKILSAVLNPNDSFFVGIAFDDVVKRLIENVGISRVFAEGQSVLPNPVGPVAKANKNGRFERKQPEEKEVITRHISFYRKKDGRHIEFDRDFNVYVKNLTDKYQISIICVTNKHGQRLFVSPELHHVKTVEAYKLNTHVINLFLEVFGDYEIYTSDLEPALAFNERYEFDILPKGTFSEDDLTDYVAKSSKVLKSEEDIKAYEKRLRVLQSFNPQIVGKGPNGFFGYITFGFERLGIVLLESMYSDNATYVFSIDNFRDMIAKNKQEILKNGLAMKRLFHYDNWEERILELLDGNAA